MPTIQLEAEVTPSELLKAVGQLPQADFDQFVSAVLTLRAQRIAPTLSDEEAKLFDQINRGLPDAVWKRYHDLIARRRDETLTPEEHAELMQLSDEEEKRNAERLQALARLAQLRKKPLPALMEELGIKTPAHE
jgi:hypothetical protein